MDGITHRPCSASVSPGVQSDSSHDRADSGQPLNPIANELKDRDHGTRFRLSTSPHLPASI